MAFFKINEPNKPIKWIKNVDRVHGTLEFSLCRDDCYQQDSGFFADSELEYLNFHFKKKYPELEYMTIDTDYGYEATFNVAAENLVMRDGEAENLARNQVRDDDGRDDPFGYFMQETYGDGMQDTPGDGIQEAVNPHRLDRITVTWR